MMNTYLDIIFRTASVYLFMIIALRIFGRKELSQLNTSDELREAMREHGVDHFSDVKLAMLETDGNISIITGNKCLRQTHYKRLKRTKKVIG